MNILELMNSRHSYRGEYENTPVPREDLIKIMQAGLAAPSGCNKQTTSLIAIDDPEVLEKLHQVLTAPVGIAKTAASAPKKKDFEERAWFNSFPADR